MSESTPPERAENDQGAPGLLWECFTNWADLLFKMESKAQGTAERPAERNESTESVP